MDFHQKFSHIFFGEFGEVLSLKQVTSDQPAARSESAGFLFASAKLEPKSQQLIS